MSKLELPPPGFIFLSVLYRKDLYSKNELLEKIQNTLGNNYIDFHPTINPLFDYYAKEMGARESLDRFMITILHLQAREKLVDFKLWADQWERETQQNEARTINIDVGMLSLENFILATGKKYSHRIYLKDGVYADLTLEFKQGKFNFFPWTYPDYTDFEKLDFLQKSRKHLLAEISLNK